ncbi:MAG: cation transporter [Clostridia bacterium]|nr:cation transporter [Clostridia bacterium]
MVTFLSKLFIKDYKNYENSVVRGKYGLLCAVWGIVLNLLLFAAKMIAGVLSNSVSVLADAFNNLSDAGSSLVTLFGFKAASKKADSDHPFGHGRYEYIAGLVVSVLIVVMGVEFIKTSVGKIASGENDTHFTVMTGVILLASILVKVYVCIFNKSIGKKISSPALLATGTDALSDCVATFAIIVSAVISNVTDFAADGWCGLIVSFMIIVAGINAAKETINPLLGQMPSKEFVEKVSSLLLSHEEIVGIHDLIVHDYAPGHIMISVHAEISDKSDLIEAHELIDNVEREIAEKLDCEAVIHMDPISTDDERVHEVKQKVCEVLLAIHEDVTIHDFRMVDGNTLTNLIFDIVVPFDVKMERDEIKKEADRLVKTIDKKYNAVVDVDRKMV